MAHNLNKYLRILFILLLLGLPIPASAEEVEEIETFDNGEQTTDIVVPPTDNSLVKIDNTWSGSYGMNGNHMNLSIKNTVAQLMIMNLLYLLNTIYTK